MKNTRSAKIRQASGNIIIFTITTVMVIVLGLMALLDFGVAFVMQNRLQTVAEQIALAGATKLDSTDQIGQINNLSSKSRQLVFVSRQTLSQAQSGPFTPATARFAQELLDESQQAAQYMSQQEKAVSAKANQDALQAEQDKLTQLSSELPSNLLWMQIDPPKLVQSQMGYVNEPDSNVTATQRPATAALDAFDVSNGYVTSAYAQNLYKGAMNTKLPSPDSFLDFRISPLPFTAGAIFCPARITSAQVFQQIDQSYIPSATQVKLTMKIQTVAGFSAGGELQGTGTACTNAGLSFP